MTQGDDAQHAVLVAYAKQAAQVLLSRTLGRVGLGAQPVAYMHPAAA